MLRTALALVAIAVACCAWWLASRDGAREIAAPPAPATGHVEQEVSTATPPPPPASLRESDVDGGLALGANGRFTPDRDALRLFDYFLSASGEEPDAALRARIVAEIARRLPSGAARDAEAFLDRYLAYRAEGAVLAGDDRLAASADLERRLQWLRELRRKHFGAELAEELFGEEERAAENALARRRVASDASLSDEERRARLEALEAELPADARDAREAATLPLRLRQEEAALRASGASDAEIRAVREQMVGPEAAERLAKLDRERAEWQHRIDAYRAERDALLGDASLDSATLAARIDELRARRFDERERVRVRTLEEIERGAPPAR